jgi:hypothetical protein
LILNILTATETQLAKSLWPEGIAHLYREPTNLQQCKNWQIVPDSFEELCDWAFLAKDEVATDKKHSHHLLYAVPKDNNRIYVVMLRLQGFISRCALTALGDWKG